MDPLTAGTLAAAGGQFLGGVWANSSNAKEAGKQRKWAAEMAGSAWQRQRIDLEAAGYNPMLAFGQGPASTPGGASASAQNPAEGIASSAMQMRAQQRELKLLDMQIEKTRQEASSAGARAQIDFRASQEDAHRYRYYFDDAGRPTEAFRKILSADFDSRIASSARQVGEAELTKLSVPEQRAIATLFDQAGGAGKGVQLLLPLLQTLIGRRSR